MCYEGQICDASASAERKTTQKASGCVASLDATIKNVLIQEEARCVATDRFVMHQPHWQLNEKPCRKPVLHHLMQQ